MLILYLLLYIYIGLCFGHYQVQIQVSSQYYITLKTNWDLKSDHNSYNTLNINGFQNFCNLIDEGSPNQVYMQSVSIYVVWFGLFI